MMDYQKTVNVTLQQGWARFFMDQSQESESAFKLLYTARFPYITFPVHGVMGPELRIGRCEYRGLDEIRKAIGA